MKRLSIREARRRALGYSRAVCMLNEAFPEKLMSLSTDLMRSMADLWDAIAACLHEIRWPARNPQPETVEL